MKRQSIKIIVLLTFGLLCLPLFSHGRASFRENVTQLREITDFGTLRVTDNAGGPGKPLYNGSVSSMSWTMGSDATQRGYKYTYNSYNWLTLAEYGEGASLTDNRNRYTEKFTEFMLNGGIRRLQRHGLKADGNHGKTDDIRIRYDGNRISTVEEYANEVTQPGSMDYPGKNREMAFGYNSWGAIVSDESRGITSVDYDNFGNPIKISYSDGSYTKNVYSASGVKLKTEHYSNPEIVHEEIKPYEPILK